MTLSIKTLSIMDLSVTLSKITFSITVTKSDTIMTLNAYGEFNYAEWLLCPLSLYLVSLC